MQNTLMKVIRKPTKEESYDTLRSWKDFFQANPWFANVFKEEIDALVKEYERKGEKLTPGHIFMAGIIKKSHQNNSTLETVRHMDVSGN